MKALRLLAAASALAVLAQPVIAPAQETNSMPAKQAQTLTIERVFESPSLNGPVPRLPKLSPDGRYLALLRNRPDDLNRYDL
jgi:dipeptidyl-peptidase-4